MTLYDLRGKKLYSGDKEIQKAYLGVDEFFRVGPSIEPGLYAIPYMYGEDTSSSATQSSSIYGYYRSDGGFQSFGGTWLNFDRTNYHFYSDLNRWAVTSSGGDISLGMKTGEPFKPYKPGAAGNYVLKYEAKAMPGEANAGYFSKTSSSNNNIGSFQPYTQSWQVFYEPPVYISSPSDVYKFYMRLENEPGDNGRVMFRNFEFIPAELL